MGSVQVGTVYKHPCSKCGKIAQGWLYSDGVVICDDCYKGVRIGL